MSKSELDRRTFIGGAAAAASALVVPAALRGAPSRVAIDLVEISLSELADGLQTGRWTAHSLAAACLARIEALDRDGPGLNSILELNPDALAIARSLSEERAATGPRSRLHGIPVLVKDSIGTADRMHTSAGSLALANYIAPHDATVIEKLRQAGCLIIGKANMSEWSNARGRSSVAGWSARGQLTHNPYSLNRSAGGSSSGSAAAVAASLVPAALGVEAMGSIVSPAAMCGIVGMKPTVGLVSRRGIIPVSSTQDTAGPMCRTVRDAALLLSVIAGPDPLDPVTLPAGERGHADYTRFLDPNGLRGARIGVARNLFGLSLATDRVMERAISMLRSGGAIIVDPAEIESADGIMAFDREVIAFELKAALNEYFHSVGNAAPVRSLADLIEFNNRNSDLVLKWFGQETFLYAQSKGPLSTPAYQRDLMLVRRFARDEGIDGTLARHRLDAIVAPTQSPAWLTDMLLGDNTFAGGFATAAAAGYPSITVPAGDVAGLPVGLLFMGTAWSEPTLLRLAFAFEQIAQQRRTPEFVPSLAGRR